MGFFSKILDKLGFDAGAGKVEEMLRTPIPPAASAKPDTSVMGRTSRSAANDMSISWTSRGDII